LTATGTPNQKVAIIIGASEGFGAAIVDAYRGLNYAVVANSRSITPSNDPGVAAVAGDIAESATADRIVTTTVERFGRVDTLINNAGIFVSKPFTEYTVADYELVTAVNLTGFFSPPFFGGSLVVYGGEEADPGCLARAAGRFGRVDSAVRCIA
jgi:NAD(P)-dependent dehydrogenase (short-subunit alcohol dehydrogenase family)